MSVSVCAAVQQERGPRKLRKFSSPAVTSDSKSSACSSITSSSSTVLPIRPCPQSAVAPACHERPMDLSVAASNSSICSAAVVDAARMAVLRHSSALPITARGALGTYDVRWFLLVLYWSFLCGLVGYCRPNRPS